MCVGTTVLHYVSVSGCVSVLPCCIMFLLADVCRYYRVALCFCKRMCVGTTVLHYVSVSGCVSVLLCYIMFMLADVCRYYCVTLCFC